MSFIFWPSISKVINNRQRCRTCLREHSNLTKLPVLELDQLPVMYKEVFALDDKDQKRLWASLIAASSTHTCCFSLISDSSSYPGPCPDSSLPSSSSFLLHPSIVSTVICICASDFLPLLIDVKIMTKWSSLLSGLIPGLKLIPLNTSSRQWKTNREDSVGIKTQSLHLDL